MDHGPILAQQKISLNGNETADLLRQELSEIGKNLLVKVVADYFLGKITAQAQNHEAATYCRAINKDEAKINWHNPAAVIEKQIRAYYSWPVAWTLYNNKRIKIFPPAKSLSDIKLKKSGEVFLSNNQLAVACGTDDALIISSIQLEGRPQMNADDFLRGNQNILGQILD